MRTIILILTSVAAWGQTSFFTSIGEPIAFPSSFEQIVSQSSFQSVCTINGSTIKCSQCGFFRIPSMGTKTVSNIHWAFGNITKTGGTTLRVGLQGVSTTTGPVIQPDGTFLASGNAYASISNASIPASNNWFRSDTVGGSLSVSAGDKACLVWEPDSYAGSDSFVIRGVNFRSSSYGQSAAYNGSAWSTGTLQGVSHLIEFTDGSFGTIGPSLPATSVGATNSINTGSTPDEIAAGITPAVNMGVVGICAENPYSTSGGDAELVLYSGTTPLATVAVDAQQFLNTTTSWQFCGMFSVRITLTAGSKYYAAIKPTTANNVRILTSTAADASYWSVFGGGTDITYSARTDGGAWSDTTTTRPHIWLLVDQAGSAGGGSGGGAYVVAQ